MSTSPTERIVLRIPNISCAHCVRTITRELQALDGIVSVEGNAERKEIVVEYRHQQTGMIDTIKKTLEEIGYPASE